MKLSSIFVGALATLASAAPAKVEEEKRNVGGFGGGFDAGFDGGFDGGFDAGLNGFDGGFDAGLDAFGVGGAAFNLAPLAIGFGGGLATGNIFGNDVLGAFNNFNVPNANVAFLLGVNNFDFNSLFTFFDLGFAVNPFLSLFQPGAAGVLSVQNILDVNNALVFQWMLNQFGNEFFFNGAFGGFNGALLPTLAFGGFDTLGFGLGSQFNIDASLLGDFGNFAGGFQGNFGNDAFNAFNFANLAKSGINLKE
jgi:hypothetical protein